MNKGFSIKYGMPADEYRKVNAVNNTSLKWAQKSLYHHKAFRDGLIAEPPTDAQTVGNITHASILEGKSDYVVHPEHYEVWQMVCPKCGNVSDSASCRPCKSDREKKSAIKPWNRGAKFCADWETAQGSTVISKAEENQILAGRAAVNLHPLAGPLFCRGRSEVSLFATCPVTGLKLKARLDYLVIHYGGTQQGYIADLKTCKDASTSGFKRAIERYRYARQMAFYKLVAELCGLDVTTFYFVALELQPIPMVNVLILKESDIEIATQSVKQMLLDIAECEESGVWPGYCGMKPNILPELAMYAHDLDEETIELDTE